MAGKRMNDLATAFEAVFDAVPKATLFAVALSLIERGNVEGLPDEWVNELVYEWDVCYRSGIVHSPVPSALRYRVALHLDRIGLGDEG